MNYYRFNSIVALFIFASPCFCQDPNNLKLKDYHPVSIFKTPQSKISKAKFQVIDLHTHDYPKTDIELDEWIKTMNDAGIEKSIILTYSTGTRFDSAVVKYGRY